MQGIALDMLSHVRVLLERRGANGEASEGAMATKRSHWITVAMVTEAMGLGDKWCGPRVTGTKQETHGVRDIHPGTRTRSTQGFGQCLQLRLGAQGPRLNLLL